MVKNNKYNQLLPHFLCSARIQSTGVQTDSVPPASPTPPTATPMGYKYPPWAKRGKELRKLADSFAKTREREKVKEKASGVSSCKSFLRANLSLKIFQNE